MSHVVYVLAPITILNVLNENIERLIERTLRENILNALNALNIQNRSFQHTAALLEKSKPNLDFSSPDI